MGAIIKLENVWKVYQMGEVEVPALRGVDIEIEEGEFVAITGPSGSGKSTMMNIVGCLDLPTKGRVFLDRKSIADMEESRLAQIRGKKIGFIFQQFNLIPTLTALENVMLPLEFQNTESKAAAERAFKLLKEVDLENRAHHLPSQLSGGEMQRVAIARALSVNPEIILADEPTGNLDSATGNFVMDCLEKVHREDKKTIVMVTHDAHLAERAERIIRMRDGKIEGVSLNRASGMEKRKRISRRMMMKVEKNENEN